MFSSRNNPAPKGALRSLIMMLATLLLASGITVLAASPSSAHTPGVTADCNGVHLTGTNYDGSKQNTWSVTIGGVTQSGTFGATLDKTFPVPQGGATTSWSGVVQAYNGSYKGTGSGTVGPCGTPPPPTCPPGTTWEGDMDGDGVIDQNECHPPTVKKYKIRSSATCVTSKRGEGEVTGRNFAVSTAPFNVRTWFTRPDGSKGKRHERVKPGNAFRFELSRLKVGSVVRTFLDGKLVDKDVVERRQVCNDTPHVGLKQKVAAG